MQETRPSASTKSGAAQAVDSPGLHYELSLALHAWVARNLDAATVARARENALAWLSRSPNSAALLRRWLDILDMPLEQIRARLTDPSEDAAWLRKASPFAGALPPRLREQIIRDTRRRFRQRP